MAPLLDALLLPKEYYEKMGVRKRTYFLCVLVIGALNLGYVFVYERFDTLFLGKSLPDIARNAALTLAFILVVGLLDSFVFCRPLIDVLSRIPGLGRAGTPGTASTEDSQSGDPSVAKPSVEPSVAKPSVAETSGGVSSGEPSVIESGSESGADAAVQPREPRDAFVRAVKVYTVSALIVTPPVVLIQEAYLRTSGATGAGGTQIDIIVGALGVMQIWMFGIMTRGMCGIIGCKGVQRALAFFIISAWAVIWSVTFSWLTLDNGAVMGAILRLFA